MGERTVREVFGKVAIPEGLEGYADNTLDQLSHDSYGVLIGATEDMRGEVEGITDELNHAWGLRYELLPDGGVARRALVGG